MARRLQQIAAASLSALAFAATAQSSDSSSRAKAESGVAAMTGGQTTWGTGERVHVDVRLNRLAPGLAEDLKVDASRIPSFLHVPVTLAAQACGTNTDALMKRHREGDLTPNCEATRVTTGLQHAVMQQLRAPVSAGQSGGPNTGKAAVMQDLRRTGDEAVATLLAAAQHLREAIQAMARAPAGESRAAAIRQGNDALMAVHGATMSLPADTIAQYNDEGQYQRSVRKLQQAADGLRAAAQALAENPGPKRNESIERITRALHETNEAMLLVAAPHATLHVPNESTATDARPAASTAGTTKGQVPLETVRAPTPSTSVQGATGQVAHAGETSQANGGSAPMHPGRVAVDISGVASLLDADGGSRAAASTVWLPAGIASDVCDVPLAELTPLVEQGTPACRAERVTPELREAMRIEQATPGTQLR